MGGGGEEGGVKHPRKLHSHVLVDQLSDQPRLRRKASHHAASARVRGLLRTRISAAAIKRHEALLRIIRGIVVVVVEAAVVCRVILAPAAFGGVMAVLTHVPRPIFRKLPF